MAKKITEDKLIEKIDKINRKMVEINKEPIKKIDSNKNSAKQKEAVLKKTKIVKKTADDFVSNANEKEIINKKKFGLFESIIILINVALVFCLLGYLLATKLKVNDDEKYASVDKEIQTFIEQYNYITKNYYGQIDKEKLISDAINGMLSSLDAYSGVLNDSSNNFDITLEGSYEGIGISVANTNSGELFVVNVYDNTPASKAGLQQGDIVIKLNDKEIKNTSSTDFVGMIKNVSDIKLTVIRNEQELNFNVKREFINLKSVHSEMRDNSIGYIQISIFANNTYEQFKEALNKLEEANMKSLIIDVRSNNGGHLSSAEKILSLFVDKKHVIYQTEDSSGIKKHYSLGNTTKNYKIAILQNENSASASELLAVSLKENLNAYIIGQKSYGKGTVQQLQTVGNIQYKFTTKKWLTPNGNWINGTGIQPDLEISLSKDYIDNPKIENDNQFNSAIDYLK